MRSGALRMYSVVNPRQVRAAGPGCALAGPTRWTLPDSADHRVCRLILLFGMLDLHGHASYPLYCTHGHGLVPGSVLEGADRPQQYGRAPRHSTAHACPPPGRRQLCLADCTRCRWSPSLRDSWTSSSDATTRPTSLSAAARSGRSAAGTTARKARCRHRKKEMSGRGSTKGTQGRRPRGRRRRRTMPPTPPAPASPSRCGPTTVESAPWAAPSWTRSRPSPPPMWARPSGPGPRAWLRTRTQQPAPAARASTRVPCLRRPGPASPRPAIRLTRGNAAPPTRPPHWARRLAQRRKRSSPC